MEHCKKCSKAYSVINMLTVNVTELVPSENFNIKSQTK